MKARLPLMVRRVGGVTYSYPLVMLRVRDRYGLLVSLPFRIDTGADCTAIPTDLARREHLPFQQTQMEMVGGLVGTTQKFRDRLRVVIAGREHDWPCDFIDVPPPAAGRRPDPLLQIPVLGRVGFLDEFAVAIDSGYVILTRLGPLRRLLRRGLHRVWQTLGMAHTIQDPL
jgi:hypothetical protein